MDIVKIHPGWTGSLILYSSIQSGNAGGMIVGWFIHFVIIIYGWCMLCGGDCYTSVKKNNSSTKKRLNMKSWVLNNKLLIAGIILGAIGGYSIGSKSDATAAPVLLPPNGIIVLLMVL